MKALQTLQAKHPEKIRRWYKDLDGYWVDLAYGWQWGGTHTVHELKVSEVLASFKGVEACDCLECKTKGEQWEYYDIDTGKRVVRTRAA